MLNSAIVPNKSSDVDTLLILGADYTSKYIKPSNRRFKRHPTWHK